MQYENSAECIAMCNKLDTYNYSIIWITAGEIEIGLMADLLKFS